MNTYSECKTMPILLCTASGAIIGECLVAACIGENVAAIGCGIGSSVGFVIGFGYETMKGNN